MDHYEVERFAASVKEIVQVLRETDTFREYTQKELIDMAVQLYISHKYERGLGNISSKLGSIAYDY